MKSIKKNFYKLIALIVLAIILLGAIITTALYFLHRPYMAVFLTTGDIYFGRTSLFPRVVIERPWFLRRAEDGSLSLENFSDAIWMPSGGMKINREKIVFMSRLSSESPVIAAIEGRALPQQQIPQQTQQEVILPDTVEGIPGINEREINEVN